MLVKKYGNRRLYDTARSRYLTLEELAESIRKGEDVRVVDAKTGEDLTTATLAQIIVEGRGAARLLPRPLLVQLIRMGDDALAEFLGQYVSWALEVYLQARQAIGPFNPLAAYLPGAGLTRMFGSAPPPPPPRAEPAAQQPTSSAPAESEMAALRRELDELKKSLKKRGR
jgi:polyhydroxyalkanoate synthesis repressor PhaR